MPWRRPRWPHPNRDAWTAVLEPLHERNLVVVDGFAPALQRCWPSCDDWKRAEHRCQPETPADLGEGENASMFWPWVGQHYHRGGI